MHLSCAWKAILVNLVKPHHDIQQSLNVFLEFGLRFLVSFMRFDLVGGSDGVLTGGSENG